MSPVSLVHSVPGVYSKSDITGAVISTVTVISFPDIFPALSVAVT